MDPLQIIDELVAKVRDGIETRLGEADDQIAEVRTLEELLERSVVMPPEGCDFRRIAEMYVSDIVETMRQRAMALKASERLRERFNIAWPAARAATVAPEPRKAQTLAFRLVQDDRLGARDRIVFSLAWKWAFCNRKAPRVIKVAKYRKATGFRAQSVQASVRKLNELGYLNELQQPLVTKNGGHYVLGNGIKYLGHRKLMLDAANDVQRAVFYGVWASNPKARQCTSAWMARATGVSVRTARRRIAALNGCPPSGTGVRPKMERLTSDSMTGVIQEKK